MASGKGWKGEAGPIDEATLRDTIDNLREHGFTGLAANTHRPPDEAARILNYAQAQGMIVTHEVGGLELFGRDAPPTPCVYSPEYAKQVRARAEEALKPLATIAAGPRLLARVRQAGASPGRAGPQAAGGHPAALQRVHLQDEPFHAGPKSFGYNAEVKAEFKKRYGYDLPPDLDSIRDEPKEWLDVINFRSDYFPDGWRQAYKIIKELDPTFKTILTHDSHNTFGAGYSSHSELAIDDVFHWGGDFADMFVFDIYPYMMFDFRFGEPAKTPQTANQPDPLRLRPDAKSHPGVRQGTGVLGRHVQPGVVQGLHGARASGEVLVRTRDERDGRGPGGQFPPDRLPDSRATPAIGSRSAKGSA